MYENAEMVPLKSDLESDIPPVANPHMSAEWCLIARDHFCCCSCCSRNMSE